MGKRSLIAIVAIGALAMMVMVCLGNRSAAGSIPAANDCIRACNDQYGLCVQAENALYEANRAVCGKDQACLKTERARHKAALDACRVMLGNCKANCP